MGGINSGRKRSANRGAVEQFPVIDLRVLKRTRLLRHGECSYDTLRWQNQDLSALEVRVFIDLCDVDAATIRIAGDVYLQSATIEYVPCPYGGFRLYFLCPLLGTRCEQLFAVEGLFASRQAHRLSYASQNEDELSRARRKIRKLKRQVDGDSRYPRSRGSNRHAKLKKLRHANFVAKRLYHERLRILVDDIL